MVIVKVIRNSSGGEHYLLGLLRYLENDEKAFAIGGKCVDYTDLNRCYHQMMCVKQYFGKTGDNPLIHIVISFDESVQDAGHAYQYTSQIADYFYPNRQTVWVLHQKDRGGSSYHAHICINSVNLRNGLLYNTNIQEIQRFCAYVGGITNQHCRFYFDNKGR